MRKGEDSGLSEKPQCVWHHLWMCLKGPCLGAPLTLILKVYLYQLNSIYCMNNFINNMVKTLWVLDFHFLLTAQCIIEMRTKEYFDGQNNTDLFLQLQAVCIVQIMSKRYTRLTGKTGYSMENLMTWMDGNGPHIFFHFQHIP